MPTRGYCYIEGSVETMPDDRAHNFRRVSCPDRSESIDKFQWYKQVSFAVVALTLGQTLSSKYNRSFLRVSYEL